jgi:drug/metabolite transporter (DMT)-like permease
VSRPVAHRAQIAAAALLFSTGGAAIKATTLDAWQVAGLRSAVAAIVLWLAIPGWRRFWAPRSSVVGLAYAATMILFVTGNKLTTAANVIFLQATAPMYLVLLGPLVLRERVRRAELFHLAAMALGMALLFVGFEPPSRTAPDPLRGDVLGALSGLTWATTIVGLRWLGKRASEARHDALGAAVVSGNLLAAAVCLPRLLPLGGSRAADGLIVAYLGMVQIGLAYVALTRGMRHVPALQASLVLLLEPVLATLWAWLLHGERPGAWSLAGCAIILATSLAGVLAAPGQPPPEP